MIKTKKWICTVCGFVYEGANPPAQCPQCKAPAEKFKELVEDENALTFVTEHVIGVAKDCDDEMKKDLNTHFMGEATEVGMYLAMSRQADREGYPEIAEADTKTNLEKRMYAEAGANADKMRIAKRAKELNLDAIHDTVHEMAKDEARHGQGFAGLYKRYFGK